MKIKILYSHIHTPGKTDQKQRPSWFSFEKCFQSLLSTLYDRTKHNYTENWQEGVELHIIYDTTRGGIEQNWINNYKNLPNTIFHEIQGGSMEKAAIEMYKIAKELSEGMEDNDLFVFQENDYIFIDGWVGKIKNLFQTYGLNGGYISLYDHNDKYFLPQYQDLVSKIIVTNTHHWRTTPSTCGSYIVNKKTFLEDYKTHTEILGDHNKFVYLTQQIATRFILSPIPGLSTHVMLGLESPTIDWEKIQNS